MIEFYSINLAPTNKKTVAVKTEFSIKDLENLSGVKAHTIRIWEKRYNLFNPERSDTNIRVYDLDELKKLLNVTHLYHQGHKISKIAGMSDEEILNLTTNPETSSSEVYYINKLKEAMFEFNESLFNKVYVQMEERMDFNSSFTTIVIPLLSEIGKLWQTDTIDPSHERFISELIKQKINLKVHEAQTSIEIISNKTVVMYLPYNEIHEIGLLYARYVLVSNGINTIYLGSNIPLQSLPHVTAQHKDVVFMTYLTTEPQSTSINEYVEDFQTIVCTNTPYELWCLGTKSLEIDTSKTPSNIKVTAQITEFNNQIKQLLHD